MTTLPNLIKRYKHKPSLKLYIKRRDTAGTYETNWFQVDYYGQKDRVINWGSFSLELDSSPSQISVFNISSLNLILDNSEGLFSREDQEGSLWAGYLNRRNSKIKVDAGYVDDDDSVIDEATVFEGIIDRVIINENYTANVTCLTYSNILTKYSISDLTLTGEDDVDNIVDTIMNQAKITEFIPFVASAAEVNSDITDTANFDASYWDVLLDLALYSNSVPYLNGSVFAFKSRDAVGSSVWDFKGVGSDEQSDIFKILYYDDEGADRVRVFWKSEGEAREVTSANSNLLLKYLREPEIINLDEVKTTSRTALLNSYLNSWEQNKRVIEFSTRFLVNEVAPLNKITIETWGASTVPYVWGGITWSASTPPSWGSLRGGITIFSGTEWKVVKVIKDLQTWSTIIRAEEIV